MNVMARTSLNALLSFNLILLLCCAGAANNLNARFPVIFRSTPGSYFGYTVALHRNSDGPIALVGAPRSNSFLRAGVRQPGVLFKCSIGTNDCHEVMLDSQGNRTTVTSSEFSYIELKDGMWLGVSLDVQQGSSQNDIVTCGHLWKNQYYRNYRLVNGVCYVIDAQLDPKSVRKLVPLVQSSKQTLPPGIYYYGYGQAGMSAAFSEDGTKLLLGAPGIYDWTGSVVSYPADPSSVYKNPTVPDPPQGISSVSYLGYSATSGRFFDTGDVFFAVGAPRDNDIFGRVYIFKDLKGKTNKLLIHQKKEGTRFAEYFGASVLGVDLNGDSLADLLVGAPFHSSDSGGDEGKVYVYLSNGVDLQPYAELQGDSKPDARFGTAIANAGDLNQDGYNDIAIGAPYEDDKGVVYIYHGSKEGMNVRYVQKIQAADIDSRLEGFGIHISRGLDIDSNDYPDILVGAYESSTAVLLRTHPVIQLYPKLTFDRSQINTSIANCEFKGKKLSCVGVSACLSYSGKNAPPSLKFENEISVKLPSQTNIPPRGFFRDFEFFNEKSATQEWTELYVGSEKCIRRTLYIYPDIRDAITPIQIGFRFRLSEPLDVKRSFDKTYPVIDAFSPTKITKSITFSCGRKEKCLSNLIVTAKMLGNAEIGELTLGETSSVSLEITVINKGDPAYLAELLIYLPPDMPSINRDLCTSPSQQYNASVDLVCDLGNPLLENREVKIFIKLDATKIASDRKTLDIVLEAVTFNTEIAPEDNKIRIPLRVHAIADISVSGLSSQEQILYDEDEESDKLESITHIYAIRNHGPSPVQVIDIMLYVPTAFLSSADRVPFLKFTDLKHDNGSQFTIPAKCYDTNINLEKNVPYRDLVARRKETRAESLHIRSGDEAGGLTDSGADLEENLPSSDLGESSWEKKNGPTSLELIDKTIVINCDNQNIDCIRMHCYGGPFSDLRKVALISVAFQVNVTTINQYLEKWNRAEFITTGRIFMRDANVELLRHHPNFTEVKTVFVHKGSLPSAETNL